MRLNSLVLCADERESGGVRENASTLREQRAEEQKATAEAWKPAAY